jgi:hypothetical protein
MRPTRFRLRTVMIAVALVAIPLAFVALLLRDPEPAPVILIPSPNEPMYDQAPPWDLPSAE